MVEEVRPPLAFFYIEKIYSSEKNVVNLVSLKNSMKDKIDNLYI